MGQICRDWPLTTAYAVAWAALVTTLGLVRL